MISDRRQAREERRAKKEEEKKVGVGGWLLKYK